MDGPNNDDLNYGGSFGLAVTNWIICFVAAVLIVVGAVMFQDAAPAGRSARAQGGQCRPTPPPLSNLKRVAYVHFHVQPGDGALKHVKMILRPQ